MINDPWEHLASVLGAENDALERLDLARAAGMAEAKAAALAAIAEAAPPDAERLTALGELARANQCLLERGIATQARVLALVAEAARAAMAREAPATCYGAGSAAARSFTPLALRRTA